MQQGLIRIDFHKQIESGDYVSIGHDEVPQAVREGTSRFRIWKIGGDEEYESWDSYKLNDEALKVTELLGPSYALQISSMDETEGEATLYQNGDVVDTWETHLGGSPLIGELNHRSTEGVIDHLREDAFLVKNTMHSVGCTSPMARAKGERVVFSDTLTKCEVYRDEYLELPDYAALPAAERQALARAVIEPAAILRDHTYAAKGATSIRTIDIWYEPSPLFLDGDYDDDGNEVLAVCDPKQDERWYGIRHSHTAIERSGTTTRAQTEYYHKHSGETYTLDLTEFSDEELECARQENARACELVAVVLDAKARAHGISRREGKSATSLIAEILTRQGHTPSDRPEQDYEEYLKREVIPDAHELYGILATPARVVVTQLVTDQELADPDDREELALGENGQKYYELPQYVVTVSEALNHFHHTVPVGSLDDYRIEAVDRWGNPLAEHRNPKEGSLGHALRSMFGQKAYNNIMRDDPDRAADIDELDTHSLMMEALRDSVGPRDLASAVERYYRSALSSERTQIDDRSNSAGHER